MLQSVKTKAWNLLIQIKELEKENIRKLAGFPSWV